MVPAAPTISPIVRGSLAKGKGAGFAFSLPLVRALPICLLFLFVQALPICLHFLFVQAKVHFVKA
ncbi:MAG: hypothetical protein CSA96_10140 [Bacteroidetes bacterium]|nr:MAG: hypothetical protein CSA96_10140 [Bacteroidota bacterium]